MSTRDDLAELDGLLAASKWRAADELTGRFIVRSVAPNADTLYERNLDDLSVELLEAVDATWRRRSHGRFGFEPQLRTLRRAHDGPELFATFVGWRRRGAYISYFAAQFDLSAPEGHLPIGGPDGIVFHDDMSILKTLGEMAKSSIGLWRERGGPRRVLWMAAKDRLFDAEPSEDVVGNGMDWIGGRPLLLQRFDERNL